MFTGILVLAAILVVMALMVTRKMPTVIALLALAIVVCIIVFHRLFLSKQQKCE